jgi:hypothetical protein
MDFDRDDVRLNGFTSSALSRRPNALEDGSRPEDRVRQPYSRESPQQRQESTRMNQSPNMSRLKPPSRVAFTAPGRELSEISASENNSRNASHSDQPAPQQNGLGKHKISNCESAISYMSSTLSANFLKYRHQRPSDPRTETASFLNREWLHHRMGSHHTQYCVHLSKQHLECSRTLLHNQAIRGMRQHRQERLPATPMRAAWGLRRDRCPIQELIRDRTVQWATQEVDHTMRVECQGHRRHWLDMLVAKESRRLPVSAMVQCQILFKHPCQPALCESGNNETKYMDDTFTQM